MNDVLIKSINKRIEECEAELKKAMAAHPLMDERNRLQAARAELTADIKQPRLELVRSQSKKKRAKRKTYQADALRLVTAQAMDREELVKALGGGTSAHRAVTRLIDTKQLVETKHKKLKLAEAKAVA